MPINDLILLFIMACSTAYAVYFLLLERKNGTNLLFEIKGVQIKFDKFEDTSGVINVGHLQPAEFQDRIRRLFGAYKVDGQQWIVVSRGDVWQCPYCLTFWMAMPGTAVFLMLAPALLIIFPVIHLAHVALALIVYHRMVNNVY